MSLGKGLLKGCAKRLWGATVPQVVVEVVQGIHEVIKESETACENVEVPYNQLIFWKAPVIPEVMKSFSDQSTRGPGDGVECDVKFETACFDRFMKAVSVVAKRTADALRSDWCREERNENCKTGMSGSVDCLCKDMSLRRQSDVRMVGSAQARSASQCTLALSAQIAAASIAHGLADHHQSDVVCSTSASAGPRGSPSRRRGHGDGRPKAMLRPAANRTAACGCSRTRSVKQRSL